MAWAISCLATGFVPSATTTSLLETRLAGSVASRSQSPAAALLLPRGVQGAAVALRRAAAEAELAADEEAQPEAAPARIGGAADDARSGGEGEKAAMVDAGTEADGAAVDMAGAGAADGAAEARAVPAAAVPAAARFPRGLRAMTSPPAAKPSRPHRSPCRRPRSP